MLQSKVGKTEHKLAGAGFKRTKMIGEIRHASPERSPPKGHFSSLKTIKNHEVEKNIDRKREKKEKRHRHG